MGKDIFDTKFTPIFVLLVAGILVGSYYLYGEDLFKKPDLREFGGGMVSLDGNLVTLHGSFSNVPVSKQPLDEQGNYTFQVSESTKFEKLEIKLPPWEETDVPEVKSISYNLKDLPQEVVQASLEDFRDTHTIHKARMSIDVTFDHSVYKETNPTASEVFYTVLINPSTI